MLTKSHLALLRAALQYFDDEMGPHGMDVMRLYFDEEPTVEWTSRELRDLQTYLRNCELRYAIYSPTDDRLIDFALHLAANAIVSGVADARYEMVTVVLPPKR
ncbi:MAG: hypothetical protein JWP89_6880 [Schlesneria sp.]|nr:hypothetical protein [Schlesneria sp.]